MPNPVKYSPEAESNSLRIGDLNIGTNHTPKGPTSTTGFFGGVNPPGNGYTIYLNKLSDGPSILVASNDAELIVMTNQIAATSYTTVNECLSYFASQIDKCALNKIVSEIATDNLNIFLDAGNTLSYPKNGSIMYDVSGKGNNATFYNSTTFDDEYIVFDGVDDYGGITNNNTLQGWNTAQTISTWVNHNIASGRRNIWNQAYGGYGTWTHEQGGGVNYYFGDAGSNNQPYVGRGSSAIPKNRWTLVTSTRDITTQKWYINQNNTQTTSNPFGVLATTTADCLIGYGYTGTYWAGKMSKMMTWDKALTQDEINTIFYGSSIVTGGLTFAVDAGVLGSYESGDTNAYSQISTPGVGFINGTLANGVAFNKSNGGSWEFDGIDDYIDFGGTCPTGNFSISSWVYKEGTGGWYAIFSAGTEIWFGLNNNGRILAHVGGPLFQVTDAVEINVWAHCVLTWDGTTGRIYVDGVEVASSTSLDNPIATGFDIGRLSTSATHNAFYGKIACLQMYDGKALSPDEVQQNYNANINRFN